MKLSYAELALTGEIVRSMQAGAIDRDKNNKAGTLFVGWLHLYGDTLGIDDETAPSDDAHETSERTATG